jgi:glycerophosphoryl diester phosphodiesterase
VVARTRFASALVLALLAATAAIVRTVEAVPGAGFVGGWRLSGRDPARGAFAGKLDITNDPANAGAFHLAFHRTFVTGVRDDFTATGQPAGSGALRVARMLGTGGGAMGAVTGIAPTPTTAADDTLFLPANDGTLSATWSRSGARETIARRDFVPNLLVIAHHGTPFEAPENTFDGCARALAEGATAIEVDVNLTRDDQIVVWHDRSPNGIQALARQSGLAGDAFRTWNPNLFTKYRRPVDDLTLAEFRANYGYQGLRRRHGKLEWGRIDIQIPRLVDMISWLANAPQLERFLIDVKLDDEKGDKDKAKRLGAIVARSFKHDPLARGSGIEGRLVFTADDVEIAEALRDGYRAEAGGASVSGEPPRFTEDFDVGESGEPYDLATRLGTDFLSIGWGTRSEKKFRQLITTAAQKSRAARARGGHGINTIVAWTLNDAQMWKLATDAGANGIITDYPAKLRTWSHQDPHGYVPPEWPRSRDSVQTSDSGYAPSGKGIMGAIGSALYSVERFFAGLFGG